MRGADCAGSCALAWLQYISPKTVARVVDEEAIAQARKEAAERKATQVLL
jgi:hypothetical protein